MTSNIKPLSVLLSAVACVLLTAASHAAEFETVLVGNTGNSNDTWSEGYGAVDYEYRIAKHEVTAGQYVEFLNAVATQEDQYGLYDTRMDYDTFPSNQGCNIKRTSGLDGYSYSVAADWANRPVNFVSWGDAARFCNWMHNGQPTIGVQDATTTERGAYTLDGANSYLGLAHITREDDATWFLPTEDEWYKAAYHANDGDTDNYHLNATGTSSDMNNELINPDPGHSATFGYGDVLETVGEPYYRTEVGEWENSASPYGTFDQSGNVYEWLDTMGNGDQGRLRGGSFRMNEDASRAWSQYNHQRENQTDVFGFRVATEAVPEPGTFSLAFIGGLGMLCFRRRQTAKKQPGNSPVLPRGIR